MSHSETDRSEAQREASRRNGALSNGPNTPEGKARSSQNAIKHGLRSSRVVLSNESQEKYNEFFHHYVAEWCPVGITETDLLTQMVNAKWRVRRIQSIETGALNNEMFIQKPAMDAAFDKVTPGMRMADAVTSLSVNNPNSLENLSRAEERLERQYERAKKQLIQLQTMRLGHAPVLIPQLALPPGQPDSDTNDPDLTGENYEEPESFSWLSCFTPTAHRPSAVRTQWTDDTCAPPTDKAA